MKGDFSRLPSAPAAASGVYLQQGRVLLDSDWNAQLAIQTRRSAQVLSDIVGAQGAPSGAAGFAISPRYALRLNLVSGSPQWLVVPAPTTIPASLTVEVNLRPTGGAGVVVDWPGLFTLSLAAAGGGLAPQLQPAAGGPPIGGGAPLDPARFAALAVVVDGTRYALLLDGREIGSSTISGQGTSTPGPAAAFTLAAAADGSGGQALVCDFAEARLWGFARRNEDIRADCFARLTGDEAGLLIYLLLEPWKLSGSSLEATPTGESPATLNGGAANFAVCDLWIGAGRYYTGGACCVNPRTVAYSGQLAAPPPPAFGKDGPDWLFYLDVWEQFETALQDPALRDPALGGPDTSGWAFTAWQVVALSGSRDSLANQWTALLAARSDRGTASIRRPDPLSSLLSNSLYRLEIHDGGVAGVSPPDPTMRGAGAAFTLGVDGAITDPGAVDPELLTAGRSLWIWRDADDGTTALSPATVAVSDDVVTLQGLDTVLQAAGPAFAAPRATFKWSSVNGCVAFPIASCAPDDSQTIRVALGSEGDNGFDLDAGDWVELTSDAQDYGAVPGVFYNVRSVDQAGLLVRLDDPGGQPPPELPLDLHPLMRRWDTPLSADGASAGPPTRAIDVGKWVDLDAGIQVSFGTGLYVCGDYWTFTARDVAGGVIAWPDGGPSPQGPQGIDHAYAPLAGLSFSASLEPQISDERTVFAPIVSATPTWTTVTAPPPPGGSGATVLFDAPFLTAIDSESRAVWRLKLNGGAWTRLPDLPTARPAGGFGRLGYDIWALGIAGMGAGRTDILTPDGAWRRGPGLAKPVINPSVAGAGGALYVLGGQDGSRRATGLIQRLDPDGCQTLAVALPTARHSACVAEIGGRLFVIGGASDEGASSANEGFDPSSRSCRSCAPLPPGVSALSAAGWGAEAAVLAQSPQGLVLIAYDPSGDSWRNLPAPPAGARAIFAAGEALYALVPPASAGDSAGGLFQLA